MFYNIIELHPSLCQGQTVALATVGARMWDCFAPVAAKIGSRRLIKKGVTTRHPLNVEWDNLA
jgi:hypothetical protein